ncbi:MAG: hypothetical protein UX89_C0006G0013 [Parcubacteria group bacterium GW2011_GWA2_47_16]|nr:MAG: hypothetical protein UX89_C0006G0013 [Parcubacteria group bacterium GW2011_GWA2_47_16]
MIFGGLISKITSRVGAVRIKASRSFEARALRHWKLLLNTFFVMTLLVLATSFFVHRDISKGDFYPIRKEAVPESSQVTVERLEKLVSYFETKRVTFELMRKNHILVVDPSR